MRRFFVPPGSLQGREVTLGADLAHRLGRVLRLKPGDHIVLADGGPRDLEVELSAVSPRRVIGAVVGERAAPPEPKVELILYQALIRANRFDLVLEKGTEVGVSRFVPVVSGRSQVRPERDTGRLDRWRRIVTEAAEQSGRGRIPGVEPPLPFAEALGGAPGLRLLPWEGLARQGVVGAVREPPLPGIATFLRHLAEPPHAVSLFIGPEGGFDPREVELARREGTALVSLGPRILRSETAGIVAATLVMEALGEMGS